MGSHKSNDYSSAVAASFMLLAVVLTSFDAVIVRMLAGQVHPFVITFFRSLFGLIVVLPWIMAQRQHLHSKFRFMHILRASMKIAALSCFFLAFASAQLADVTAVMFIAPIFLTIGGWIFFNEKRTWGRIIAIIMGFVGVIIVIRPGDGDFSWALIYALIGSALTAAIQLMLKIMAKQDSTQTLVVWNLLVMAPLAALPAFLYWTTPTSSQLILLATQGALGALSMSPMTRSLSMAEASFLAPIDFVRLPIVAILAFLLFKETAQIETWVGACVIFSSTFLVAGGASWNRRKA